MQTPVPKDQAQAAQALRMKTWTTTGGRKMRMELLGKISFLFDFHGVLERYIGLFGALAAGYLRLGAYFLAISHLR